MDDHVQRALKPFLTSRACPPLACCDGCAQVTSNHFEPLVPIHFKSKREGVFLPGLPYLQQDDSTLPLAFDAAAQAQGSELVVLEICKVQRQAVRC